MKVVIQGHEEEAEFPDLLSQEIAVSLGWNIIYSLGPQNEDRCEKEESLLIILSDLIIL